MASLRRALLLALCAAAFACNDEAPSPHALLPGQSNQITPLPRSVAPAPIAPPPSAAPLGPQGFADRFDRAELGPDWLNTGAPYKIDRGKLVFSMAHNHPLWLNRALPKELRIDFDCAGLSPDGDVKVELFGDGHAFENDDEVRRDVQYTATGYVFIFGGWKNQLSTIVKQREHAWQLDKSVPRKTDVHVEPGRSYHWTITRQDRVGIAHLDWQLDGKPFLAWDDPNPLDGPGHDRFAFEGWESPISCTNLKIQALASKP